MPAENLATIFAELNELIARESVLIDWDAHNIPRDQAFEQYRNCEKRVRTLMATLRRVMACNYAELTLTTTPVSSDTRLMSHTQTGGDRISSLTRE